MGLLVMFLCGCVLAYLLWFGLFILEGRLKFHYLITKPAHGINGAGFFIKELLQLRIHITYQQNLILPVVEQAK